MDLAGPDYVGDESTGLVGQEWNSRLGLSESDPGGAEICVAPQLCFAITIKMSFLIFLLGPDLKI